MFSRNMLTVGSLVFGALAGLAVFGPLPQKGDSFRMLPKGPKKRRTPLVLVHGMCCGSWVFRALADRLVSDGWEVHCITMEKARFKTLSMYMDELRAYIDSNLNEGPVLLGHSLGGMLVQQYTLNEDTRQKAEKRVKGLVFVASFGSHNCLLLIRSLLSVLRQNLIGTLWALVRLNGKFVTGMSTNHSKKLMFRPATTHTNMAGAEESLDQLFQRASPVESGIVLLDLLKTLATTPHAASPQELRLPALSVIPADDALLLPWTQREMASFWGSEEVAVPGQGHFVGDAGWEAGYAQRLEAWLRANFE